MPEAVVRSVPVIVNYAQLRSAFDGAEAARQAEEEPDEGAPVDEVEAALMVASVEHALVELEAAQTDPSVLAAPDDRFASLLQSVIAEHADELGTPTGLRAGGSEVRFDGHDWRWVRALYGLVKDKLNVGTFRFLPPPTTPTTIPDQARIAILGDWGTGLYGAPRCAQAIEGDPDRFAAIIHLGDVYYSGTEEEVRHRFLDLWPTVPGAVNRACNSNHEMYSGGRPYAELTLPAFDQSSSCWWLENEHWMVVGLDTAYDEADIGKGQVSWLEVLADRAADTGRRLVCCSHHQVFSHAKAEGHALVAKLEHLLEDQRIFAWYWGHEHLCTLFDQHPDWGLHGRCIGHSGYPYDRPTVTGEPIDARPDGTGFYRATGGTISPPGLVLDGPNPHIEGHEDRYGPNGYAVIELDGPTLRETIRSATGEILHDQTLA